MNETLKTLMERRSVRSYKEEQVPENILQQILEAGEYAPSGMGCLLYTSPSPRDCS